MRWRMFSRRNRSLYWDIDIGWDLQSFDVYFSGVIEQLGRRTVLDVPIVTFEGI